MTKAKAVRKTTPTEQRIAILIHLPKSYTNKLDLIGFLNDKTKRKIQAEKLLMAELDKIPDRTLKLA